uniref:Putative ovule protein n=1 Tax=Solanum chacoense TaxID=4108 RepID=A0A0V0HH34_SOLCH
MTSSVQIQFYKIKDSQPSFDLYRISSKRNDKLKIISTGIQRKHLLFVSYPYLKKRKHLLFVNYSY